MLAAGAVIAFRWAVRDSQFDDLESPAVRILDDGLDANDSTAQNFRPSGEERAL
jgi:cbb3-type cytochrome oxidase maturation protein